MLITVKESTLVWTAPDGNVKIWDITDSEGQKWQTRSQKIADSVDQTLDCTIIVSKSNKTYLVQTPREGSPGFQSAAGHQPGSSAPGATERFERAVERFEKAVDRLSPDATPIASKDVLPTSAQVESAQELADFFGGEIENDL